MTTPHDNATVPFNDLSRYAARLWDRAAPRWNHTLNSGRVILGSAVEDFEAQFAAYLGGGTVVGVASGTDALELAMRAVGVNRGSSVVLAANAGFYASTAICAIGANPRFVDVDPAHVTPGVDHIEGAMATGPVDAVVVTHLYGRLAFDIERIAASCREAGVPLVEDCAQSHGSRSTVTVSGAFGDVSAFSFYPTKNLGACGEGGAFVSKHPAVMDKAQLLRVHGSPKRYSHTEVGFNFRMDGFQGAVLNIKLKKLAGWTARRRAIAAQYRAGIRQRDVQLPVVPAYGESVWHQFTLLHPRRDELRAHLEKCGVGTEIIYPGPMHLQPCYATLGYRAGSLPVTERTSACCLSLPIFPELTDEQVDHVIKSINAF